MLHVAVDCTESWASEMLDVLRASSVVDNSVAASVTVEAWLHSSGNGSCMGVMVTLPRRITPMPAGITRAQEC